MKISNSLFEDIKYDMQYGVMDDLSGIQITSGDGKVLYDSISLYDGYYEPTEALPAPRRQTAFWMF